MFLRKYRHVSRSTAAGTQKLEAIFRHKVFKMLLKKGKITEEMVNILTEWKHSGFNIFCGNRIAPIDETDMEDLEWRNSRLLRQKQQGSKDLPRHGMAGGNACPVLDTGYSHIPIH